MSFVFNPSFYGLIGFVFFSFFIPMLYTSLRTGHPKQVLCPARLNHDSIFTYLQATNVDTARRGNYIALVTGSKCMIIDDDVALVSDIRKAPDLE
jgi:hypothetical protein